MVGTGLKAHPVLCPDRDTCHCPRLPKAAQLWGSPLTTPPSSPMSCWLCAPFQSKGGQLCKGFWKELHLIPSFRKALHLILLYPGLQLSSLKSPRIRRPHSHGNPVLGLEFIQLLVYINECLVYPFLRKCGSLALLTPALQRQS